LDRKWKDDLVEEVMEVVVVAVVVVVEWGDS
jgi:hypothetical protein